MRIESVAAHAFGPLVDETLELAPGMTVVVGDNESAKSSWHAALYAALCGRRRAKGKAPGSEQRFVELHKPWGGGPWVVSAVITLDDGRRIELVQDLDGKVDCHATDLGLGRDVSDEIMNEGSPDAARWVGLDRRSFLTTACIEQAQLLRVLDGADGLQAYLERAAATAGSDATATEALERLDAFRREHVGRDDGRSTKPARRARVALEAARQELEEARDAHGAYLTALEHAQALRARADKGRRHLGCYEAAAALRGARALRATYQRVAELDGCFGGVAPAKPLGDDALARQVAGALASWRSRPKSVVLDGPTSAELEERLASLPTGDASLTGELWTATGRVRDAEAAHRRAGIVMGAGAAVVAAVVFGSIVVPRVTGVLALAGIAVIAVGALMRRGSGLARSRAVLAQVQERERELAASVETRDAVEAQLHTRQHVEAIEAANASARAAADAQVAEAARGCGLGPGPPEAMVAELEVWEQRRHAELVDLGRLQGEWAELEAKLAGQTVDELERQVQVAEADARSRAEGYDPEEIAAAAERDVGADIEAWRDELGQARTEAASARGALDEQAKALPSVADAEEAVARAVEELARVRQLDETLAVTSTFLEKAQESVQRDIAPRVSATLTQWLGRVTAGRYVEAMVDPETLEAQVRGDAGRWRHAGRLSHGTAEQVYLLLRLALVEHLTAGADTCPLVLDDVTVQADAGRTDGVLALLHELSAERQVILFSQERRVAAWAAEHLRPPADALRELPVVRVT